VFCNSVDAFCAWLARSKDAAVALANDCVLFALRFGDHIIHALGDATNLAPLYAFVFGV